MPLTRASSVSVARRLLKGGYFRALAFARVERLMREIHAHNGAVLVLSLHRISPSPNPYWPPLTPEAFDALAAFLSATCQCSTFSALPVVTPPHRPTVILSFDDGCRDFIEYAMPVLHRHHIHANHNVIGESVETGRPPWQIMLCDALNAASHQRINQIRVQDLPVRLTRYDEASKTRFGVALCNVLKAMDPVRRRTAWPAIQALFDETSPDRWTEMMSESDVREVADVHELGGHSYSHESMEHLDDEEFTADVDACSALLARMDQPLKVYAFPNDSFRTSQFAILRERGVEHLLVGPGPRTEVPGLYRRLPIYGDSPTELKMRALAAPLPGRVS
jgi:peptidoglycan/xylan/chitin deacetylase (PgdA/CDA1 family)